MYALSVELRPDQEPFAPLEPVIHVDAGVQVEEAYLERSTSPVPTSFTSGPLKGAAYQSEEAELASVNGHAQTAGAGTSGGRSKGSSPFPRRSGGASPWLIGGEEEEMSEEEDEEMEESEDDDEAGEGDADDTDMGAEGSAASPKLELAHIDFLAGHPTASDAYHAAEVGSIGFYRYEQPSGVFGLRPPPLRSNVVCITAVPSWLR